MCVCGHLHSRCHLVLWHDFGGAERHQYRMRLMQSLNMTRWNGCVGQHLSIVLLDKLATEYRFARFRLVLLPIVLLFRASLLAGDASPWTARYLPCRCFWALRVAGLLASRPSGQWLNYQEPRSLSKWYRLHESSFGAGFPDRLLWDHFVFHRGWLN